MPQQVNEAATVAELAAQAGHKAHLDRERALSRIEELLDAAGKRGPIICMLATLAAPAGRVVYRQLRAPASAATPLLPAAAAALRRRRAARLHGP